MDSGGNWYVGEQKWCMHVPPVWRMALGCSLAENEQSQNALAGTEVHMPVGVNVCVHSLYTPILYLYKLKCMLHAL